MAIPARTVAAIEMEEIVLFRETRVVMNMKLFRDIIEHGTRN